MASSSSDLFRSNSDVVSAVRSHTKKTIDSLEFVLCWNGEADDREVLPLVHTPAFDVELSEIPFPPDQEENMQSYLKAVRDHYGILLSGEENSFPVSLTPVVVALPGSLSKDDSDGHGATSAEFVPFYNNHNETKRVVAITIFEDKIRYDHLTIHADSHCRGMTCPGRHSDSPRALKATEIPNEVADRQEQEQPEAYAAMKKNACMVIFMEYDFEKQPSPGGELQSASDACDISRHAVISDGGALYDDARSIQEEGTRYLSNVKVYTVQPLVVNTRNQPRSDDTGPYVVKLMKEKLQELNDMYLPYKRFSIDEQLDDPRILRASQGKASFFADSNASRAAPVEAPESSSRPDIRT